MGKRDAGSPATRKNTAGEPAQRLLALPTGQVVRAPVIYTERGLDLTGRRFGALTALRVVQRSQAGNVWLCSCDCGSYALRTAAALNYRTKLGQQPACRACVGEARSGGYLARLEELRGILVLAFHLTGELYTARWEERELAALRELAGIEPPPEPPESFAVDDAGQLDWSLHPCTWPIQPAPPAPEVPEPPFRATAPNPFTALDWQSHPRRLRNAELVWCPEDGATWRVGSGAELGAEPYDPLPPHLWTWDALATKPPPPPPPERNFKLAREFLIATGKQSFLDFPADERAEFSYWFGIHFEDYIALENSAWRAQVRESRLPPAQQAANASQRKRRLQAFVSARLNK
jgi:hypothetical protein